MKEKLNEERTANKQMERERTVENDKKIHKILHSIILLSNSDRYICSSNGARQS